MSEHHATVEWERTTDGFDYDEYNREHQLLFDEPIVVVGSAAPEFKGKSPSVDPEQAFVASLSACHMLTFLAIASKKRIGVLSYTDNAVGYLEKNEDGKLCITRVMLRPVITFEDGVEMDPDALTRLHERAHDNCFIANSVLTEVVVEPA